eukprot:TRINITY_DN4134_c0_g1_i1.p2 TRINITY_DN4134_c0_g1~~TRINITY_DN4134_c0_g1_i1.p2  ORF type:complete len:281 (+),score=87.91 TRINITY_DN4134_c0_g1_i1:178-1020(+)
MRTAIILTLLVGIAVTQDSFLPLVGSSDVMVCIDLVGKVSSTLDDLDYDSLTFKPGNEKSVYDRAAQVDQSIKTWITNCEFNYDSPFATEGNKECPNTVKAFQMYWNKLFSTTKGPNATPKTLLDNVRQLRSHVEKINFDCYTFSYDIQLMAPAPVNPRVSQACKDQVSKLIQDVSRIAHDARGHDGTRIRCLLDQIASQDYLNVVTECGIPIGWLSDSKDETLPNDPEETCSDDITAAEKLIKDLMSSAQKSQFNFEEIETISLNLLQKITDAVQSCGI